MSYDAPVTTTTDVYPVTVRGPVSTNGQGVVTFARLFTHEGQMYLAESRDKGRTVSRVSRYDLPEGSPTRPGRAAKWGPWSYSSCGCSNSWRIHTREALAALVKE